MAEPASLRKQFLLLNGRRDTLYRPIDHSIPVRLRGTPLGVKTLENRVFFKSSSDPEPSLTLKIIVIQIKLSFYDYVLFRISSDRQIGL
jgi:hypothetical protein